MRATTTAAIMAVAAGRLASAGTMCLAYSFLSLGGDTTSLGRWDFFPVQGNPCEDAEKVFDSDDTEENLCEKLPVGFHVCGQDGNLVRDDDAGTFDQGYIDGESDCGVRLEIGGEVYGGRVVRDNTRDCSGTCGDREL